MDFSPFSSTPNQNSNPALSADGMWQQADYFKLCSDSYFWGCAFLTRLSRSYAPDATTAFLYLLQRVLIEDGVLDKENISIPTHKLLDLALTSGYIDAPEDKRLTTNEFWESYKDVTDAIAQSENAHLLKNGRQVPFDTLLELEDVRAVTSFAHTWNNRQYFIEAKDAWLFFGWATMA